MFAYGFVTDYVQVVDMGTLELRISAAKPGLEGKLVRTVSKYHERSFHENHKLQIL